MSPSPSRFTGPGLALASLALFGLGAGCANKVLPAPEVQLDVACAQDPAVEANCNGKVDGGTAQALGLVGYTCNGSARPDDHPGSNQGVPEGLVCANLTSPPDSGVEPASQGYCCSAGVTTCALDPVATCDPGTYGYQCRGSNRPEAFNPNIRCGQGIGQGDLINYCCSGTPPTPGCTQVDTVNCSMQRDGSVLSNTMGFRCTGLQSLPEGQDLGANKSRADQFYLLCPVPTALAQAGLYSYCCLTAALVPPGGSCLQDTTVPGCAPGRFGIACTGPDTPEQDYPPLICPSAGVPGTNAQGYPATVYCCDLQ